MTAKVKSIPEGYTTVTPYLTIKDAEKAIEFYKKAFDAKEIGRLTTPEGKIGHCELQIGDSRILLSDEMPGMGGKSSQTLGGSPITLCLYLENADEVYKRALSAGAKVDKNMEMKDQFYGDRSGTVTDPFGLQWTIGKHIEDVSFDEMQKRYNEVMSKVHS
ncbi:MAG: VOC family protein [Bacteroidota bacterium]